MHRYLAALAAIILLFLSAEARKGENFHIDAEVEVLLQQLDSLLDRAPEAAGQKRDDLLRLSKAYFSPGSDDRRYWLAADLYEGYSTFDSDSALAYADRALELAQRLGRKDLIADMQLNRAYVLSATGVFTQAQQSISDIDVHALSTPMLRKYCDRLLSFHTRRDQFIGNTYTTGARPYPPEVDSLLQATITKLKPSDPDYCWLVGWGNLGAMDNADKIIPQVQPVVDSSTFSTRNDAMNAWVLAQLYEREGDYQQKFKYLLRSAIADARISNREIASLEEVASILLELGQIDRANAYVTFALACANEYKSRVRQGALAKLQEQTMTAIQQRSEHQALQNHRYLVGLVAILLILLCSIIFILRQMRLLHRSRRELRAANDELQTRYAELQHTREELDLTNARLREMYDKARDAAAELSTVNESKEASIANIFTICSNYINKLDDFRKNIYRMIVARRFDDTLQLTKSPELSQGEVKELYATFDKIFLEIYPDFVADFNSLLRPGEEIEPRKEGSLTTELRIYALVRLGLNDSVKIAQFLHMSPQTVYNARQRTRNKARVPRDEFAAAVRALGRRDL